MNLADASTVAAFITTSASSIAGVDTVTVAAVASDAASVITASNAFVQSATTSGADLLTELSQIAAVAQGDASQSLLSATQLATQGDLSGISTSIDNFTGTALETAVASAPVGDVDGANSSDTITGTASADNLMGYGGSDILYGLGGNDTLDGGDGADTLDGGTGFNILRGGAGDDSLIQSAAISASDGGRAEYTSATSGIMASLGVSGSTLGTVSGDASVGTDTLNRVEWVVGSNFDDTFIAGATFVSGDGSNFNEFTGGGGNDSITGNGGTRIAYQNASSGVTVDLQQGTAQSIGANDAANVGVDTFTGVNQVRGSSFDDVLYGSNGGQFESFRGQAGNDLIDGRGGNQDRADYRNSASGIVVQMGVSGIGSGTVQDGFGGTDTLLNIEQVRGSEFADTITMDDGNNRVVGQGGNDLIRGMGGTIRSKAAMATTRWKQAPASTCFWVAVATTCCAATR